MKITDMNMDLRNIRLVKPKDSLWTKIKGFFINLI